MMPGSRPNAKAEFADAGELFVEVAAHWGQPDQTCSTFGKWLSRRAHVLIKPDFGKRLTELQAPAVRLPGPPNDTLVLSD